MNEKKKLTFCLMDAPYENARSTTALRLIDIAVGKGHDVYVFAYEGAVGLPFSKQKQHPNAVHGRDAVEENHPTTQAWVQAIADKAKTTGSDFRWCNCGLCVDERGMNEALDFVVRGTPGDLVNEAASSVNALIIATK
jgi:tRNA 2-thiouridine synthesizing protein D